ncbi:UDP-glucuronic acid decarboxylase family protein [Dyella sp.]|uniref:UDP-glucuronic acid decarboxylase family protein n=1 Tax=Dyella sp. TaxID=1869338 RepID=UPI002D79E211|nr:UDP-glucuronic acid decarboxylase family protein [Dyella sp.]HET6433084.1 UDP-glucuronic acid decarboxylase family protein [Dyella sp.]
MANAGAISLTRSKKSLSVLVAGAAGFVGSHLVDRLLKDGHRVIGVDNFITGRPQNLAHLHGHPRFQFIEHDLVKPLTPPRRIDWVMHLASPASPPKYQQWPIETMQVNSFGTHHLLDLARRQGATFLLASTSEVYGDPLLHPQREEHWGHCNPNGPRSMYDEGKRYAEAAVMTYHRHFGLPVRIVRIFNTYGPRMDPRDGRIVTNFIHQALADEPLTVFGDGSQTRSLQYVSDLVEGLVRFMGVDETGPVNLGNPVERTVRELAELVISLTGSRSTLAFHPLPENDPRRRRPDISLARRLLGWTPEVSVEDGLALTIEAARHALEELPAHPSERALAASGDVAV